MNLTGINLNAQVATPLGLFLEGLLAFFVSPCVLPMLPVYAMVLVGGTADAEKATKSEIIRRALGLLCGFVIVFTLMGAGAGWLGGLLKRADPRVVGSVSGGLMLLFGLMMLDVIPGISLGGVNAGKRKLSGFFSSLGFGVLLVLSWTACLSPMLGQAMIMAASHQQATVFTGMAYLALFAVGLCLPMLIFMFLYQWLKGALTWIRKRQQLLRRIAGAVMIAYGLYTILAALL